MDDLTSTLRISAAGMRTQGTRLRVIAENIANADSLPTQPGELPYRRRVVTFRDALDETTGLDLVRIRNIENDSTPFPAATSRDTRPRTTPAMCWRPMSTR
jgi:flagellar basal-body rod protein FlgC